MDRSHPSESFRGLLLRHRGRSGLTQRDLAARIGASARSLQDWEAGVKFPTADRLQALIGALLEVGGLADGREESEARELWTAAERKAARMRTPFDAEWFTRLLATHARTHEAPQAPSSDAWRRNLSVAPVAVAGMASIASGGAVARDWGEAPDTIGFVGRAAELARLRGWVLEERCRLVAVLGMGGIGKTTLAARLARTVADSFEHVYWRSLRNSPPASEWLAGAIAFLSDQLMVPPSSESERITALLQLLRARRCLLVLDNAETLFEPGQREGRYRAGMGGYDRVLQAVGEASHQSCLLLTSREVPPELAVLGGGVRGLELRGLGTAEAQALLADKQLQAESATWVSLVDRYNGNGLALKIVGETIRQVYDGDVAGFLGDAVATYGTVFGGIRRLLDAQAERLSPVERDILTRLAVQREPISVAEVSREMAPSVGRSAVVEAIETLRRRSLVERGEPGVTFTLQSMVLEYVTDRLVETVADEIGRGQPNVLLEQPLIRAQAKDYVRQTQERLIGAPILQQLNAQHGETGTESRLLALLEGWRGRPAAEQGFGPGNVVNLLRLLRGDLRGMDLSRLALRQVYLQGVDAQDTSLAGSQLTEAILAEAFSYSTSVALSAVGTLLVAGTPTGDVRVWRAADRTLLQTMQGHSGMVWCVAVSADGGLVASGADDQTVKLWETSSGRLLSTLHGHTGGVRGVALSRDGQLLASCAEDGAVRLWQIATGTLLSRLEGHTGGVWGVAFSGDGRLLASCGVDGTVHLWELSTETLLHVLIGHAGLVFGVAVSEDGRLVASAGADGTVHLWDGTSGQLHIKLQAHTGGLRGVALSDDAQLLASAGGDSLVKLWDTSGGELLATLTGHTSAIWAVALSADGRLLASAGQEGTVRLWDAAARQPLATIQGHTGVIVSVALSGDGRMVASDGADGTVRLWDSTTGQLLTNVQGRSSGLRGSPLSPDGNLLASGDEKSVRVWQARSNKLLGNLQGHSSPVWCVALSGNGRILASGGVDETVRLWDTDNGRELVTLRGHTGLIWGIALSEDGRRVASGGVDGTVRLWDADTEQLMATFEGHGGVLGVTMSADGRLVASGGLDGTVRLWDAQRLELHAVLRGHVGIVYAVALSGDGQLVASGGADGMIRLWAAASGEHLLTMQDSIGSVLGVSLSRSGELVASGGDDGWVRLWDARSGECMRALRSDRHYQRLDITDLTGVTNAQRTALLALGAIEHAPA
jgi:WD40 repeat protein/transcriptional regulator with XRE-family HTH domain